MNESNPCTDKLTDLEYIIHMIPHHQVAVDMSELLIPKISDPVILDLCRKLIIDQQYEIFYMNDLLKGLDSQNWKYNEDLLK